MGEYICPKCNKPMSEMGERCVECQHCFFRCSIDWLSGWYAALKSGAQPPQADNSDYAAALRVYKEFEGSNFMPSLYNYKVWLDQRLHSDEPNVA